MSACAVSCTDAGGNPPVSSTRASSRGQKDYDRPRVKRATHRPERELRPGRIAASAAQAGNGPLPIEERAATSPKGRDQFTTPKELATYLLCSNLQKEGAHSRLAKVR